jgi:deoxyribose-phosphate aldolase
MYYIVSITTKENTSMNTQELASLIDHSILHPATREEDLPGFCDVVNRYKFAAAYVLPANLPFVSTRIQNGVTKIGTGVGFPFGTPTTRTKLFECEEVIELGADELDVVINIGALKSGNYTLVRRELEELVSLASPLIIKSILEVSYLTDDEIVEGSKICCDAGVAFVKTATGFGSRPTTIHDLKLMIDAVGGRTGVKAAGGIKDIDTLLNMYRMGVTRFGISSGDRIVDSFVQMYGGRLDLEEDTVHSM